MSGMVGAEQVPADGQDLPVGALGAFQIAALKQDGCQIAAHPDGLRMVLPQHLAAEPQALPETRLRCPQVPLPPGEPPLIVDSVGQRLPPRATRPAGDLHRLGETVGRPGRIARLGGDQPEAVEILGHRQGPRTEEPALDRDRPFIEPPRLLAVPPLPGHVPEQGEKGGGLALGLPAPLAGPQGEGRPQVLLGVVVKAEVGVDLPHRAQEVGPRLRRGARLVEQAAGALIQQLPHGERVAAGLLGIGAAEEPGEEPRERLRPLALAVDLRRPARRRWRRTGRGRRRRQRPACGASPRDPAGRPGWDGGPPPADA